MDNISIQLNREISTPLYLQIVDAFKNLIINHILIKGDKLPPIRILANKLSVNTVTIINAYKELENFGYVKGVKGSGYYVCDLSTINGFQDDSNVSSMPLIDDNYENNLVPSSLSSGQLEISINSINFGSVTPDPSIFPIEPFKDVLNEVLDRDKGFAFGYQESNGYAPLRESLASFTNSLTKSNITAEHIQIVSGAQQGIDIVGKTLLNPSDYVITENPTYTGAVSVFKSRGAKIVGIPMEQNGMNLALLEKYIQAYKPKLIYVMTKYQNPTTLCYSVDKMERLLDLSEKYNVYLVEDDSLSGLSFDNNKHHTTLKSLDIENKNVIYIKSFSKLLMPGLRIGFLACPKVLSGEILQAKHNTDISSSGLIQRSLDLYFRNGNWENHINYMKSIYKKKYDCMLRKLLQLKKYGIDFVDPMGGLNFWITLPKTLSSNEIYEECLKRDVIVVPGKMFFVHGKHSGDNTLRLSYAATNEKQIEEGLKILEDVIIKLSHKNHDKKYMSPIL